MMLTLVVIELRVLGLGVVRAWLLLECTATPWLTGRSVDVGARARKPELVVKAGSVAVGVAVAVEAADTWIDTEFVAVGRCGKMKVRVDVGSEAADEPSQWDSGKRVVLSA